MHGYSDKLESCFALVFSSQWQNNAYPFSCLHVLHDSPSTLIPHWFLRVVVS